MKDHERDRGAGTTPDQGRLGRLRETLGRPRQDAGGGYRQLPRSAAATRGDPGAARLDAPPGPGGLHGYRRGPGASLPRDLRGTRAAVRIRDAGTEPGAVG